MTNDVRINIDNKEFSHRTLPPLIGATKVNNERMVKYLVENGADINIKYENETPYII